MGTDTKIPASHKAPLLLSSIGNSFLLESTVAALRTKKSNQLTWESVTADLIKEWSKLTNKAVTNCKMERSETMYYNWTENRIENLQFSSIQEPFRPNKENVRALQCSICGNSERTADRCFNNPGSENCKLPEKALDSIRAMKTEIRKHTIYFGG